MSALNGDWSQCAAAAAADTHVDSGADDHAHAHVDADPDASTMLVKMLQNASKCFNASKDCCYYCYYYWEISRATAPLESEGCLRVVNTDGKEALIGIDRHRQALTGIDEH